MPTYWIASSYNGNSRRIHTDKDCVRLQRSNETPEEATDSQAEWYDKCRRCFDEKDEQPHEMGPLLSRKLELMNSMEKGEDPEELEKQVSFIVQKWGVPREEARRMILKDE